MTRVRHCSQRRLQPHPHRHTKPPSLPLFRVNAQQSASGHRTRGRRHPTEFQDANSKRGKQKRDGYQTTKCKSRLPPVELDDVGHAHRREPRPEAQRDVPSDRVVELLAEGTHGGGVLRAGGKTGEDRVGEAEEYRRRELNGLVRRGESNAEHGWICWWEECEEGFYCGFERRV